MQYENYERLNKQGMWFVIFHTLVVLSMALNFGFFA